MSRLKWILAITLFACGQAAFADADDIEDDANLTPKQKEQLKNLKESFQGLSAESDKTPAEKQQAVRDDLRTVLVQKSQPSDKSVDKLADTLAGNLAGGNVSMQETLLLAKKLTLFLDKGDFSIDSNRGLVKELEGVVQNSKLGPEGRNQLYNAALTIVNTADGNARNKR